MPLLKLFKIMKKQLFIIALLLSTTVAFAQTKQTKEEIKKDSIIKADIIDPAERDAQGEAPDLLKAEPRSGQAAEAEGRLAEPERA